MPSHVLRSSTPDWIFSPFLSIFLNVLHQNVDLHFSVMQTGQAKCFSVLFQTGSVLLRPTLLVLALPLPISSTVALLHPI